MYHMFLTWAGYVLAAYLIFVILFHLFMTIISLYKINHYRRYERPLALLGNIDTAERAVSIVVPAYNEEAGVLAAVSSLLNLNYKSYEIIIVNDGSTDSTANCLIDHFGMEATTRAPSGDLSTAAVCSVYTTPSFPNLILINKENAGKADALNCGINYSSCDYVCTVDGDSVLEKNSIKKIMRPFALYGDRIAAVGGAVELVNGNTIIDGVAAKTVEFSPKPLVAMQSIEYYRSFLIGRVALSEYNLMLICSGAFTVFDKNLLITHGGLATDIIGEDMEIVIRLQKALVQEGIPAKIVHAPDAICYTEAPESFKVLHRQRRRWHQGLLESLWQHKNVTLNPRYRSLGLLAFPYFIVTEATIPVVQIFGFAYLIAGFFAGQVFLEFSLILLVFSLLYSGLLNLISVMLHSWQQEKYPNLSEISYILGLSFTEFFWYKPFILLWQLEGIYRFFAKRTDWGVMERTGLVVEEKCA